MVLELSEMLNRSPRNIRYPHLIGILLSVFIFKMRTYLPYPPLLEREVLLYLDPDFELCGVLCLTRFLNSLLAELLDQVEDLLVLVL